jgi:uncharacterized protein YfaS (alpha-2-macroglobulin family)
MLRPRKKIRELEKKLETSQNDHNWSGLVEAISANGPQPADRQFEIDLKNKLLEKHSTMNTAKKSKEEKKFSLWSDFRIRGWAMALGTLVVVILAAVAAYPMIPAPTVKGYVMKGGTREISVNAPLKITFNQLMNNASVEKAFAIEPAIKGDITWQGNSLVFKPLDQFKIGDTYKISIGKGAVSLFQKPLEGEYSEFYKIVAPPKVILMTPNDASTGITADTKINIMFDRPMTGLTTLEAGRENFPDIKIEPAVKGRFKWLGTSAIQFIPDKLNLATSYKVTIPKGTAVLDGGYTEEEFSSSFETIRPESLTWNASDTQNSGQVSSNSKILLDFNQKVDLDSARQMIRLNRIEENKNNEEAVNVRYLTLEDWKQNQKRAGELLEMSQYEEIKEAPATPAASEIKPEDPKSADLEKTLVIEPVQPMKADSNYSLQVRTGVKGFEGPLTTKEDRNFDFRTLGVFKLVSADHIIADSTDLAYPLFNYSNPVDFRSLRGRIKIDPARKDEKGELLAPEVSSYSDNGSVHIGYNFLPSTDYVITIDPGVKDIFGNAYNEKSELKFKTNAYKPALSLEKGTDISVLDGYQPAIFYLKSVNVDFADVKLKKLTPEEFSGFYANGYIDYSAAGFNQLKDFTTEGRLDLKLAFNEQGHTALNLDEFASGMAGHDKLESGFYFLEISNPNVKTTECTYDWQTPTPGCHETTKLERTLFVVSRSSLAIKTTLTEMLVWATDLKDGKPVAGEKITVMNPTRTEMVSGETDASGLVKLKLPGTSGDYYRDFLIFGDRENDASFVHTSWSEGIAPWNFNINTEPVSPEYYLYLYTDRPIYRPAQEVFFKGIIRQEQDYKFKLPEIKKVRVTINDSQGNQIYQQDHAISNNGTFNGKMMLGDKIPTGDFSIHAELLEAKGPQWMTEFYASFKVYEYRKPEYKLDITSDKKEYVNGQSSNVRVEAGYFFGAPLKNAEIKWTLKAQDYYFILPEDLASKLSGGWFSFADEGFFCYWGCSGNTEVVSQGSAKADEQGVALITLPLNINDKKISQIYTMEVTVTDANNQSVSNRLSFPVHKGSFYAGIRSVDYIVEAGKPAKFEVLAVSTDGKALPGKSVEVGLYERLWNTVKRKNVDGDYYYENSYDDKLIEKKSLTTGENGLGSVEFTLAKGGVYKVEAVAKDDKNNQIISSTTVYVCSGDFVNWGSENNDKIELITDKMEYKVGDTAKVLVKSPYKNVYALVTYEKDKVLDQKVVKLESNSQTIEVPITEKFLPNAFVSVVLVKGDSYDAGLAEPAAGAPDERQVASFKVGYTTLQVNTENKRLNIEIKSDKARYVPGETVKLTVKTTDASGKVLPAEVSLAVVDESVLSLTESVTADLLNVFYRKRLLGVNIAESLTKAISRINVQVEAGMKGGGGGGDLAKRGIFKDTAYFEASLHTNENGEGTLEFKIPDNLTTWQVMAIGISDDSKTAQTLVGSNKYSFLANKDILVRPVLPRFMSRDDQMQVSALVHNYTDSDQSLQVKLEAEGLRITDASEKSVNIPSQGSQQINWQIVVGKVDSAKLSFTAIANGGQRGDSIEQTLPVQEASMPENVALGDVINDQTKKIEQVWLPVGLNPENGTLKITAAATLAGAINDGLKYLVSFPYGCSEQLASAILPNVAAKRLINTGKFKLEGVTTAEIDKNVQTGLQELYKNQQSNGGFGLWGNSSTNAWLTAYVTNTLFEAEKAGYKIDKAVYDSAIAFLKGYLNNKPDPNESEDYRLNTRAYVLFVLAENGQGDLGLMNSLFEQKDKLRLISKANLLMALQDQLAKDKASEKSINDKITAIRKDLENSSLQTPRGVSFEEKDLNYYLFDTNTRTTAVIMKALNRVDSNNPLLPKIMQALLRERKGGHFSTTQETAVSLLAMLEYLEKGKELTPAYEALIDLNGKNVLDSNFTSKNLFEIKEVDVPLKDLLPNNLNNEVAAQKVGEGRMYFDLNLEYYLPLKDLKPESEGLEVLQEYFSMDDGKLETPLEETKVGENLHGKLTVIVPEDRHYVMIEDFLPAGLEGVDFNLNTSEQGLQDMTGNANKDCYDNCSPNWYFNHSEVRDNRIMYFADFLPKGVYEIDYYVRSTSVGTFADLPAVAQETYFPEVFGRSEGKSFKVTE